MMARKAREEREKEHLHWQEVFRVFTMPSILPGTAQVMWHYQTLHSKCDEQRTNLIKGSG